eukprot:Rhum_TRINITY_DN14471_c0_g1::Rhum_TRINITY_DN14471_c0_g1_i2::g.90026::m.90026
MRDAHLRGASVRVPRARHLHHVGRLAVALNGLRQRHLAPVIVANGGATGDRRRARRVELHLLRRRDADLGLAERHGAEPARVVVRRGLRLRGRLRRAAVLVCAVLVGGSLVVAEVLRLQQAVEGGQVCVLFLFLLQLLHLFILLVLLVLHLVRRVLQVQVEEGVLQQLRRRVPLVRVPLQAPTQEVLDRWADVARDDRRHVGVRNLTDEVHHVCVRDAACPRLLAGDKLEQGAANTPHIGSKRVLSLDRLGCDVRRSAHKLRLLNSSAAVFNLLGGTEVGKLHGGVDGHQQVGRLDVTMEHAVGVEVLQPMQYLGDVVAAHDFAQTAVLLDNRGQRTTVNILQVDAQLRAILTALGVEVPHNVVVRQCLQQRELIAHFVVCRKVLHTDNFDGHKLSGQLIDSLVHGSERTLTQTLTLPVPSQSLLLPRMHRAGVLRTLLCQCSRPVGRLFSRHFWGGSNEVQIL